MENRNMQYERWLAELDQECRKHTGYPWNAICHDASLAREAYLKGETTSKFIDVFMAEHKPCLDWHF